MVLYTTVFWRGKRNWLFIAKLQHFILLYEKKNKWEKKIATIATRKKFKMVIGVGILAGLEKVSLFFGDVGLKPQNEIHVTS